MSKSSALLALASLLAGGAAFAESTPVKQEGNQPKASQAACGEGKCAAANAASYRCVLKDSLQKKAIVRQHLRPPPSQRRGTKVAAVAQRRVMKGAAARIFADAGRRGSPPFFLPGARQARQILGSPPSEVNAGFAAKRDKRWVCRQAR